MKKTIFILFMGLIITTGITAQDFIKYPIKSGSVNYTMNMMGVDNNMVVYFTGNGGVQCTDVQMEMFGQKIHSRSIVKGKTAFNLDMTEKTYTVEELSEEQIKKMSNYFSDKDATMEGVTKLGEEVLLGKNCQIYSMNKDGADMKLWIWEGLMLKMETVAMGMTVNMVASAISETAPDPALFEIPSDFIKKEQ